MKSAEYTYKLQDDFNKAPHWAQTNNMALNGEKFEVLRYGNNENLKKAVDFMFNN